MANSGSLVGNETAARCHPRARLVESFVDRHGVELLRVARSYSADATDADDAYQRALEILLTKGPEIAERQLLKWTVTVVRNEALQIRRHRRRMVAVPTEAIEPSLPSVTESPEERAIESELDRHAREALDLIKADEMRCLVLKASGMSYNQIGTQTGFSQPKINRLLSEGRKAFRGKVVEIETGRECQRLAPAISLLVDGRANAEERKQLAAHLEGCGVCRATLRVFTEAAHRADSSLPLLVAHAGLFARVIGKFQDSFSSAVTDLQNRFAGHTAAHDQAAELALAKKATAVAAIAATLAAGGAAVKAVSTDTPDHRDRNLAAQDGASGEVAAPAPTGEVRRSQPDDDPERHRKSTPPTAVDKALTSDQGSKSAPAPTKQAPSATDNQTAGDDGDFAPPPAIEAPVETSPDPAAVAP